MYSCDIVCSCVILGVLAVYFALVCSCVLECVIVCSRVPFVCSCLFVSVLVFLCVLV